MKNNKLILIGGGGHCKSCIEVIESKGDFIIAGIIDVKDKVGTTILGYPVIGCDDDLVELRKKYSNAHISLGQIKSNTARKNIFKKLKELDYSLPVISASSSVISKQSKIGEGTIIMHQAIVNAETEIGVNCIVNTKALIEHDCKIGNNCHVSTGAILNGNVIIGDDCFIGSNATFVNGLTVTNLVTIGINSLVSKSIEEEGIYVGSPLRKIK